MVGARFTVATVSVNVADACSAPSLTVTVMLDVPAATVPLIVPLDELIASPEGSPVAV